MVTEIILYCLLVITAICYFLEHRENKIKTQKLLEMAVAIEIFEQILGENEED